jgi:hypothetical protein
VHKVVDPEKHHFDFLNKVYCSRKVTIDLRPGLTHADIGDIYGVSTRCVTCVSTSVLDGVRSPFYKPHSVVIVDGRC